jgi:hypothetical protein
MSQKALIKATRTEDVLERIKKIEGIDMGQKERR